MLSVEETIERWVKAKNPRRILDLSRWDFEELPDIPDEVEYLDISHLYSIKHLKKLPKSLKWLHCKCSEFETIEIPLPPNLTYLNTSGCSKLEYIDVPKHITHKTNIKYFERIRRYEKEFETEDHSIVIKRRIEEWIIENKNKKHKTKLDLSGLQVEEYVNIPNTVEWLVCDGNKAIKTLKGIPESLKKLDYRCYPLKEFDYLPNNLEYLQCNSSKIEELDNLPNSIKKLEISYYPRLRKIISLPNNLKELDLSLANDLEEICCQFPPNLRKLNLSMTYLNTIPYLPETLTYFDISMNITIKQILNLPKNIKVLSIFGTSLKSLPQLPDTILRLDIDTLLQLNNNSIPNSIRYFESKELKLQDPTYRAFNI
jgi:hypothetical protein